MLGRHLQRTAGQGEGPGRDQGKPSPLSKGLDDRAPNLSQGLGPALICLRQTCDFVVHK